RHERRGKPDRTHAAILATGRETELLSPLRGYRPRSIRKQARHRISSRNAIYPPPRTHRSRRGGSMDITIGLPNTVGGVTRDSLLEWSRRAEARGFPGVASLD